MLLKPILVTTGGDDWLPRHTGDLHATLEKPRDQDAKSASHSHFHGGTPWTVLFSSRFGIDYQVAARPPAGPAESFPSGFSITYGYGRKLCDTARDGQDPELCVCAPCHLLRTTSRIFRFLVGSKIL